MPVWPYVKVGAPFTDHPTDADATFAAADANAMDIGIKDAHLQPAVRVFHNTTQSIPDLAFTTLAFNSERFDQAGGATATHHDNVTNNSRLTCLYAGIYHITGNVSFATAPTLFGLQIVLNAGLTVIGRNDGASFSLQVATTYSLAVNDFVQLQVLQDSAGAQNALSTANWTPEFTMVRVA